MGKMELNNSAGRKESIVYVGSFLKSVGGKKNQSEQCEYYIVEIIRVVDIAGKSPVDIRDITVKSIEDSKYG